MDGSDGVQRPSRRRTTSIVRNAQQKLKADFGVGVLLLLLVVCLWTGSNFITQDLYVGGYVKPFLVTYLNTASFAVYLLPVAIRYYWAMAQAGKRGQVEASRGRAGYEGQPLLQSETDSVPSNHLSAYETAHLAFAFCILWFIANLSVNASLNYTSVASATIFSSMSGFFTLGIGRLFKVETLNFGKIFAVITSFGGCVLVSLSDAQEISGVSTSGPWPLFGDAIALLSALFYALYVILLKVRIKDESRIDMQLFFGFVGLVNILTLWPVGVILDLTQVEPFRLPTTRSAIAALLINMFITWSSDYIYVFAMLKTTPLVVTIGLSLTIPLAITGDLILLGKTPSGQALLGAVMVLGSFVLVGLQSAEETEEREEP